MRMKRSLLVKVGEALAPDAFQLVLDSESDTKGRQLCQHPIQTLIETGHRLFLVYTGSFFHLFSLQINIANKNMTDFYLNSWKICLCVLLKVFWNCYSANVFTSSHCSVFYIVFCNLILFDCIHVFELSSFHHEHFCRCSFIAE